MSASDPDSSDPLMSKRADILICHPSSREGMRTVVLYARNPPRIMDPYTGITQLSGDSTEEHFLLVCNGLLPFQWMNTDTKCSVWFLLSL